MANHTHVHNAHALQGANCSLEPRTTAHNKPPSPRPGAGKLKTVAILPVSRPTMPLGTSPHDPSAKRQHNPHALEGHLAMVNIADVTSTTTHLDVRSSHSRRHLEELSTCGYYDEDILYADNSIGWKQEIPDQCACRLACGQDGAPYYSYVSSTQYCMCKAIRTSLTAQVGTHSGVATVENGKFECTVMPYPPPSAPPISPATSAMMLVQSIVIAAGTVETFQVDLFVSNLTQALGSNATDITVSLQAASVRLVIWFKTPLRTSGEVWSMLTLAFAQDLGITVENITSIKIWPEIIRAPGAPPRPPFSPRPPRAPPPSPPVAIPDVCDSEGADDVCNPFVGAQWSSAIASYHFYLYDETPDGTDLRLWEWPRVTPTDGQLANNGICMHSQLKP